MTDLLHDTIVAIATGPGVGGVGVVRLSGPLSHSIALTVCSRNKPFTPRYAHFSVFFDAEGQPIDEGLVLCFQGPRSFTGEDVVELQGHGGPVVLQLIVRRAIELGARLARPGEFSERAFLNDKLDLLQAEAIADLIACGSEQAARSAMATLKGAFSDKVDDLYQQLVNLRMHVEAAIDFPEEEIDFLADEKIQANLDQCVKSVAGVLAEAKNGLVLNDGVRLALVGPPNAGKSSLMNYLVGEDRAIVADVPGTTRDILNEAVTMDGITLHISDTAGLRNSRDQIEQEGIRRAHIAIREADVVIMLFAMDERPETVESWWRAMVDAPWPTQAVICVFNKIDLCDEAPFYRKTDVSLGSAEVSCSLKTLVGVEGIKRAVKEAVGFVPGSGCYSARKRHIEALKRCLNHLKNGTFCLQQVAGELLAEELRLAAQALGDITGVLSADDLLGEIFSGFCIGK